MIVVVVVVFAVVVVVVVTVVVVVIVVVVVVVVVIWLMLPLFSVVFGFEKGSHYVRPWLALTSQRSTYLCLLCAGMKDLCHQG